MAIVARPFEGEFGERLAATGREIESRLIEAVRYVNVARVNGLLGRLTLIAFVAGGIVEALLALRLWAQLTAQNVHSGLLSVLHAATSWLVAPFTGYEMSTPIKQTGIFEVATVTAMEMYLIGMLATVFGLTIARVLLYRLHVQGMKRDAMRSRGVLLREYP
jgi:hypothetical protein